MSENKELILEKKTILNAAVTQLNKEFIGLSGIIDEMVDLLLPWWLFPEHQLRPCIINLWGMTGSGKTALVKRFAQLINYQQMLLRFDMGEFGGTSTMLKYRLTEQLIQFHNRSPIIVLDEFQFAKTKEETGKEANNVSIRVIWDLLDSGEIIYEPNSGGYYHNKGRKALKMLRSLSNQDIQLQNGILTSGAGIIAELFKDFGFGYHDSNIDRSETDKPVFTDEQYFISDVFATGIYELDTENFTTYKDVVRVIKSLPNFEALLHFMENLFKEIEAVRMMDLSKSLIFVIGNLDEAFYMSSNINPDIDADEFHKNTLKINIADIKSALQSRFRNEQIARLGNNHLIYHAFTHKNYQEFINLHLGYTNDLMQIHFNISIDFDNSVKEMIYKEGVFPTQGVRPVMSTIRNLIESNFSKIMLVIAENDFDNAQKITWAYKSDKFYIGIFDGNGAQIHKFVLPVMLKINSLRKSLDDDLQALIGIHESGHTIASIMFAQLVPEYVISRTVDSESNGFTFIELPVDISTFKFLKDRIRIGLGGYVAERLIFGKENNTSGTSRDIETVTQIAHEAIRNYGMNNDPIKLHLHEYGGNPFQGTVLPIHEQKAQQLVLDCLKDVEACLETHKPLLIEMGRFLSKNSRINKPEIKKMVLEYGKKYQVTLPKFIDASQYYNFKEILKSFP